MTKLSISQTGYPKKIIIGKDTGCVITITQLDEINSTYIDLDECKELTDSLKSEINNQDKRAIKQTAALENATQQIDALKVINEERKSINENDKKMIKQKDRKIKWLTLQRNILVGVTAVVTIIIIVKMAIL